MAFVQSMSPEEAKDRLEIWLNKHKTNAKITEVEFPKSSGLSADTILLTASWDEDGQTTEQRLVARLKPSGSTLLKSSPVHQIQKGRSERVGLFSL